MIVSELIEKLSIYIPDTLVVVDGYEEGFAEGIQVKSLCVAVKKHGDSDSLYGRHGRIDKYGRDNGKPQRVVVFIGEGRHLEDGS